MILTYHRLYHIQIRNKLDLSWQEWFEGLQIEVKPDGTTLISGIIDDQCVLHTVLAKIRDINFDLISINYEDIQCSPK